ncbi:MAG: alpha/beta fold hydrolase [Cytophagales bacterium]|nr:alpha/beta fold hydrolase [Rhizobacter sp.]
MSSLPRLFFAHANGFTPEAYRQLLQPLRSDYAVEAPALKPLRTGNMPAGSWHEIAADLGEMLDASAAATVGVGHSLGAVALLMAAAAQPKRFQHLVLIEPPAIAAWAAVLLRHAPASIRQKSPLARAARRRADRWATFEEALAQERSRRWFARVPDAVLSDVLEHGLREEGGAWRLSFHKEWEARLYETPTSVWPLLKQPLPPITLLRGAHSAVLGAAAAARWRLMRPQDRVIEVANSGHLLPLELPQQVAAVIAAQAQAAFCR